MKTCNGPCEQGRRECPTPLACEVEDPPQQDIVRVVLGDLVIAVMLVAVVAAVVLGVVK